MGKKRGHGEGTVTKRADGRWMARLSMGNGERRAVYGKSQRDVVSKLRELQRAQADGVPAPSERLTVGKYLEDWLEATQHTVRHTTYTRYAQYVRIHTVPHIGNVRLSRLTPSDAQRLYALRLEQGASPTSVKHQHTVLHKAFTQAVRWGFLGRNVLELVDSPRMAKKEMNTLTVEQVAALLEAARNDRLEALYALAVTSGMRQGELLALRWRDVSLDGVRGKLQVTGNLQKTANGLAIVEPKTRSSRRTINLSDVALDALKRHRTAQLEERLRLGAAWKDLDLVFANHDGGFIGASNLMNRSFKPLLISAGLPRVRFHDLRHTAASLLFQQGVNVKVISEMLGHSSITITLDTYAHVIPTMHEEAARVMDGIVAGARG
jgi:integrase